MPEMESPEVHVDEPGPGPVVIQGVSTSVTAFVGPTAMGPAGVSAVLTSFAEFEAAYGAAPTLQFSSPTHGGPAITVPNYMAMAAKAFFDNGGEQLCVSRVVTVTPPVAADYQKALAALTNAKDISIVAAPGSSVFGGGVVPTPSQAAGILAELIAHVNQAAVYRFAVLETPPGYSPSDAQALRSQINCNFAALYYPWVTVVNPLAGSEPPAQLQAPPSGFVCGVYGENDAQRGVFHAPANIALRGAVGLERAITDAETGVLNPLGIDCLRTFPGVGTVVWGARTVSSNTEWMFVNVSRYMIYLEQSISQGTQWVVFEPNGPALWTKITTSVENFLTAEWHRGGMQGAMPQEAFFVKCDAMTMTQNDIDNGRVICLVGVALLRPAEFVIFRLEWQMQISGEG